MEQHSKSASSNSARVTRLQRGGLVACCLWLGAAVVALGWSTAPAAGEEVVFSRDVLPILSANCFACHGPDHAGRQADLRFDEREGAVDLGAIVPGSPEESEMMRRIHSSDEDEVMPPPATKKSLSAAQKDTLEKWIRAGAEYQPHWSFVPPVKAPAASAPSKANQNPIDWLIVARLQAEKMEPTAEADRMSLIRRVTLDLTGLPPTAGEVEQFVNDRRPEAYEALVDRLLASPHYGERMALEWLDAARYADTNGYSIDGGRHMWLWRDWVINAFNANLPYDDFLVDQLAGDLLPEPTDAQLIATGFMRNNMVTHEGGTIPEENLTNYNADRVKTYGEAILGLTLGCAQCHDHKYDPLTQRDYFQLFAYFNTASDVGLDGDGGNNPRPIASFKTVLQAEDIAKLQERITKLQQSLDTPNLEDLAGWEQRRLDQLAERGSDFELHQVKLLKVSTPNSGSGFEIEGNAVVISSPPRLAAYDILLEMPKTAQPISGFRVVFKRVANAPGGGVGYGASPVAAPTGEPPSPGTFLLTAVSLSADPVPGDQVNLSRLQELKQVTASSWLPGYRPEEVLDLRSENGWSPDLRHDESPCLTANLVTPVSTADSPYATVQLNFGNGGSLIAAHAEIFAVTGVDDGTDMPEEVIAALRTPRSARNEAQSRLVAEYFADHSEETALLRAKLANARERLAALTQSFPTMVMDEAAQPRETHILNRGDYAQPTEKVAPGVPAALPPLPAGAPANRLGLAQWTIMPENPLTARVAVNRIWKIFFGTGLVASPANFGAQGDWPSHPELLDWLAVDFREHEWDVKRLVRMLVTSAPYRRDSATTSDMLARDPANQLLARGPRFRLPAEFVRDAALASSGLLVDWVGGPSVNPYAPGDLWREVSHYGSTPATSQTFVQDHGEKLYRRSLYTYWKRTAPPPNLTAFDAPNRETCTVSRSVTTTPLQSLVMLNDVQFVEAARALAERMVRAGEDDGIRVRWAFRKCLSRDATQAELEVVERLLQRERDHYAADSAAAIDLLSVGESPRDETIALAEHAAWTQAAALVLNLSEFVTRN